MDKSFLHELTTSTGLPEELLSTELKRLIAAAGLSPESVTLDDLRVVLAEYLQDVFVEAKENLTKQNPTRGLR